MGVHVKEPQGYYSGSAHITQPKFVVHISKAGRVILPVAEKIQFSTLASEENLTDEHEGIKSWSEEAYFHEEKTSL